VSCACFSFPDVEANGEHTWFLASEGTIKACDRGGRSPVLAVKVKLGVIDELLHYIGVLKVKVAYVSDLTVEVSCNDRGAVSGYFSDSTYSEGLSYFEA